MARGRLDSLNLDDRSWQDIVDQAKALIPTYAPDWTDHNPSDLGITLVELFAWMVEGMTYRLNRVPEKNLVEFLKLIGVTRAPARPASTYLTYRIDSTLLELTIPKGSQVATLPTENENGIVFETDEDLRALPLNLVKVLVLQPESTPKRYEDVSGKVGSAPLAGLTRTIAASNYIMFALGFDAATAQKLLLRWRFLQPVQNANQAQLIWSYSQGGPYPPAVKPPLAWPVLPSGDVEDQTKGFLQHGSVTLKVPTDWGSENPKDWDFAPVPGAKPVDQKLFWIGVRINNLQTAPWAYGLAHVLINSVPATNALTIAQPEVIGTSNGRPFQAFELRNRPLYRDIAAIDRYHHLHIQVREPQMDGTFGDWVEWVRADDFPEGEGRYYRLNPVTGVVDFGSFHSITAPEGHGTVPQNGAEVQALTYRYVAGDAKGNVPAGAISVIRTPLLGLVAVQNLGGTTGGVDEEAVEETKRRGPELLRGRTRAVTLEDYEYLAQEASPEVKKVRALPARLLLDGTPWTYAGMARVPGSVQVVVVPDAPFATPRPMPTDKLLHLVSDYLSERRIITTTLHVTHPRYLPIDATVEIQVWDSAINMGLIQSTDEVANDVLAKIRRFLHPIHGGLDGRGWEVGQDVTVSTLFEYIRPAPEIGLISQIQIIDGTPDYSPRPDFGRNTVWVQLADFELVCSGSAHKVATKLVAVN